MIDKDTLKNELPIEQVYEFVADLGGNPHMRGDYFTATTICHGGTSEKLYYYNNTHLFQCYSNCGSFDIYELAKKVEETAGREWSLPKAVAYVASYFGYSYQEVDFGEENVTLEDWKIFSSYADALAQKEKQIIQLKKYNPAILKHMPRPRIIPWEKEGISKEVIAECGICYDPVNQGIVIPHYDIEGNLIGIRERTLIDEVAEFDKVKYRPAIFCNQMYNHPLGYNLYNLNNSKENVKIVKKVIVFESEKASLMYRTYWHDSDISVACCGSSLTNYQVNLLLSLGVNEIIVAFDRQYKEIGDEEFKKWTQKLINIHNKYKNLCQISFVFDKEHKLGYKMAPIDAGAEIFLQLFQERIFL